MLFFVLYCGKKNMERIATSKGLIMRVLLGREGDRDLEGEVTECRPSPPGIFVHPCLYSHLGEE